MKEFPHLGSADAIEGSAFEDLMGSLLQAGLSVTRPDALELVDHFLFRPEQMSSVGHVLGYRAKMMEMVPVGAGPYRLKRDEGLPSTP